MVLPFNTWTTHRQDRRNECSTCPTTPRSAASCIPLTRASDTGCPRTLRTTPESLGWMFCFTTKSLSGRPSSTLVGFFTKTIWKEVRAKQMSEILWVFFLYFNFVLIRKKMCLKIIRVLVSNTAPLRLTLNQRVHERLTVWLLSVAVLRLPATPRYFCWLDYRKHLLDRSLPDALV